MALFRLYVAFVSAGLVLVLTSANTCTLEDQARCTGEDSEVEDVEVLLLQTSLKKEETTDVAPAVAGVHAFYRNSATGKSLVHTNTPPFPPPYMQHILTELKQNVSIANDLGQVYHMTQYGMNRTNGTTCVEGNLDYITLALSRMKASPIGAMFVDHVPTLGICASAGYATGPYPEGCWPLASVWMSSADGGPICQAAEMVAFGEYALAHNMTKDQATQLHVDTVCDWNGDMQSRLSQGLYVPTPSVPLA